MIPNGDKREANTHGRWHCLKKLLTLLRGICSKHNGDFCNLNCLHSLVTEKIDGCNNKHENLSPTKVHEHVYKIFI